jgi:hypothetical protein
MDAEAGLLPSLRPPLVRRGAHLFFDEALLTQTSSHRMRRRNAIVASTAMGLPWVLEDAPHSAGDLSQQLPERRLSARSVAALDDRTCAICCEEMQPNEEVSCMPCDGLHSFHTSCVRTWLSVKPQCPTCRWMADESGALQAGVARAAAYLDGLRDKD